MGDVFAGLAGQVVEGAGGDRIGGEERCVLGAQGGELLHRLGGAVSGRAGQTVGEQTDRRAQGRDLGPAGLGVVAEVEQSLRGETAADNRLHLIAHRIVEVGIDPVQGDDVERRQVGAGVERLEGLLVQLEVLQPGGELQRAGVGHGLGVEVDRPDFGAGMGGGDGRRRAGPAAAEVEVAKAALQGQRRSAPGQQADVVQGRRALFGDQGRDVRGVGDVSVDHDGAFLQ